MSDDGAELRPGAVFTWSTFGLGIESKVADFEPYARLSWYGYAPGQAPAFYHVWSLRPVERACQVVTEEAAKGPDVVRFRDADAGRMHRGHDLWLAALKWVSEGR